MKTAMQEMIDWLKNQESICIKNGNQYQADFLNGHILVALSFIEKEKQQITKAYDFGYEDAGDMPSLLFGEDYYNKKYNNETNT